MSGLCMGGDGLDAPLPRNPSHFSAIQPNFGIIRHVSKSQNRPSDHATEFNFCKVLELCREEGRREEEKHQAACCGGARNAEVRAPRNQGRGADCLFE